jgi:magnesium-transporting ATPase (P-type)
MSNDIKKNLQSIELGPSQVMIEKLAESNQKQNMEEFVSLNIDNEISNRVLLIKEKTNIERINNINAELTETQKQNKNNYNHLSNNPIGTLKNEHKILTNNNNSNNNNSQNKNNYNFKKIPNNQTEIVDKKSLDKNQKNQNATKIKSTMRKIFINNEEKNTSKYHYPDNFVRSSIYTWYNYLPKSLLFQFRRYANIYFLFITILQCIPEITPLNPITAVFPFVFVLCISMIREAIEDIKRHKQDAKENTLEVFKYDNSFLPTDDLAARKLFISEVSKNLQVGNIVKLTKDTVIPADLILFSCSNISKTAYIETSNLDGEKNLKPILCLQKTFNLLKNIEDEQILRLRGKIRCIPPTAEISTFNGEIFLNSERVGLKVDKKNYLYKGTTLKDTDWAIGIVVYTGKETKIILNINKSNGKTSHLEMLINKLMILIFGIQLSLCIFCAVGASLMFNTTFYRDNVASQNKQRYIKFGYDTTTSVIGYNSFYAGFTSFFSYLLLFNTMIPISLVVTLEMVKYGQGFFMMWDVDMFSTLRRKFVEVNSCSLNEEMGQIKYIFSDKTGTLTTNKLVFKKAFIWDTEFGKLPEEIDSFSKNTNRNNDNNKNYNNNNVRELINPNNKNENFNNNNTNYKDTANSNKNYFANSNNTNNNNNNNNNNNKNNAKEIDLGFPARIEFSSINSNSFPFHEVKSYSVYGKEGNTCGIGLISGNKKSSLKLLNTRDLINQFLYCISLNQNCFINKTLKTKARPGIRRITTGNQKRLFNEKASNLNNTETSHNHQENHNNIENWEINYTGESPDEIILTNSIKEMGVVYFEGDDKRKVLGVLKGTNGSEYYVKEEFEILKVMEFNSERGMSSIVVQKDDRIFLYSKGGDGKISLRLSEKNNENKHKIFDKVKSCSEKGYRVLCSAMKILDNAEYQDWSNELNEGLERLHDEKEKENFSNEMYFEIEKGLILLGCTVVEDKLQDNVPETIKELQSAGVNIWVLTGDNLETARNIGIACNLLSEKMQKYFLFGEEKKMKENMEENLQIFVESADAALVQEAIKAINSFQEQHRKYYPVVGFNSDKSGIDKVHEDYVRGENLKVLLFVVLKKIKEKMLKENQNPEFNGTLRGLIIETACLNCILPPPIKDFPSLLYNHPLSQLFLDVALSTQAVVCCR